jgi:hypothetical protein
MAEQLDFSQMEPIAEQWPKPVIKPIAERISELHLVRRLAEPKFTDHWTHGEGQILAS